MTPLPQRCMYHPSREPVGRCAECRNPFCRECVTEHDDRLICAACLARSRPTPGSRSRLLHWLGAPAGVLTAWLFFWLLGWVLVTFS